MMALFARIRQDLRMRRFIHFVLIGVVNTAFGYTIFAALHQLASLPAHYALAISFCIGVLWNYWTHARFVFDHRGLRKLPPYIAAYVAIYALNASLLEIAMRAHIHPLVAQAFLTLMMAVIAFFLISRVLTGHFPIGGHRR